MQLKLAENIRAFRRARGLTQEQLAEALGVTVGAVSKWELGGSTPELPLIVEMAVFFETSVDVLLGYTWHKQTVEAIAGEISRLLHEKKLDEAIPLAEGALQKYPNSFAIVYQSALLYHVMLDERSARRALALFERAYDLIEQNTDEKIGPVSLQNRMAEAELTLGKFDQALRRLRQNNHDGLNNAVIGSTLATNLHRPDEALPYLSEGLINCTTTLFRICVGYINAYVQKAEYRRALDMAEWLIGVNDGLTAPGSVSFITRSQAILRAVCAELWAKLGDMPRAEDELRAAKTLAERFDAAPEYGVRVLKFYHGSEAATAYDDFGETTVDAIDALLREDDFGAPLLGIWETLSIQSSATKGHTS